jgi:hypothetical protein
MNETPTRNAYSRRPQIEAAIGRLPILRKNLSQVGPLVDTLSIIGASIEKHREAIVPPHLRLANATMVKNELEELEKRLSAFASKIERKALATKAREKLVQLIRGLHEPTILVLSAVPPVIVGGEPIIGDVGKFKDYFSDGLEAAEEISADECRL